MKKTFALVFLLVSLFLLPLMVSQQSLWIDEGQTASYATSPSLLNWGENFWADTKSEGMMPLPMFLAWIFAQVIGASEFALRLPNLIYLGLAIYLLWKVGNKISIPFLPLLFAVNPFVWQYADEARPYALQIGLGTALLASSIYLIQSDGKSQKAWLSFFACGWLLSATSLMAVFPWSLAFIAITLLWRKENWQLELRHFALISVCLILFIPLAAFYFWALQKGASGAKIWSVGLQNLAFAGYEFFGFQGLGPGRTDIREAARLSGGLTTIFKPYLLPIFLLALAWLCFFASGWPQKNQKRHHGAWLFVLFTFFGTLFVILTASYIVEFPFWGRHLSPLIPFFLLIMAIWFSNSTHQKLTRISILAISLLLLISSICLRFSPRFAKDDYRTAAQIAKSGLEDRKTIWWAADSATANYYGLEFSEKVINVMGLSAEKLKNIPMPDIVLISKKDIYDPQNAISSFLTERSYTTSYAAAFIIYQKSAF